MTRTVAAVGPLRRVVSLVPSLTESILSWGVTPLACTRFCEQPGYEHVGGTKDPDLERIVALEPDVVLLCEEENRLEDYQAFLLERARVRREENSYRGIDSYDRLREIMEGAGGFVYAGWCGSAACEEQVKDETKATIRVIPDEEFRSPTAPTKCLVCGEGAQHEVVWARAY